MFYLLLVIMLSGQGSEDLVDLVIKPDVLSEALLQDIIEGEDVPMGHENEGFQEDEAGEDLAVVLDSLVKHILQIVVCEDSRLANRLRVLEVMLDSSDREAILDVCSLSCVLCLHEGLVK